MNQDYPLQLGKWGEDEAARYLERQGLRIVDRHYRQKFGEIDLVALDGDVWVFVEVKTRSLAYHPSALDAITYRKRRRMMLAAFSYMKWKRLVGFSMRFDFVLIEAGRIEWISDAFEIPSYYTL